MSISVKKKIAVAAASKVPCLLDSFTRSIFFSGPSLISEKPMPPARHGSFSSQCGSPGVTGWTKEPRTAEFVVSNVIWSGDGDCLSRGRVFWRGQLLVGIVGFSRHWFQVPDDAEPGEKL